MDRLLHESQLTATSLESVSRRLSIISQENRIYTFEELENITNEGQTNENMADDQAPTHDNYDWATDIAKFEGDLKDLDDIWELATTPALKQRFRGKFFENWKQLKATLQDNICTEEHRETIMSELQEMEQKKDEKISEFAQCIK